MAYNLLIIEDDEIVARTIERSLRGQEFHVSIANSGVEGLKAARITIPDLVILDVIMPGMDGYTACREMRLDSRLAEVPVLFLTAKIKEEDKITGFKVGADDYLCKPFNIDELMLRVRAILRRTKTAQADQSRKPAPGYLRAELTPRVKEIVKQLGREIRGGEVSGILVVGEYILDTLAFELHTPERGKLRLTPVQYDLLYQLMSRPQEIFSPARLLDEVWDYPSDTGSPDLVRVHIKNLRDRIEPDPSSPKFIRTVTGFGYTVNPELGG